MTDKPSGREFEVMNLVAELIDTLPSNEQLQVMAMLAARYKMNMTEKRTGTGYHPIPRRGKAKGW